MTRVKKTDLKRRHEGRARLHTLLLKTQGRRV